MSARASSAEAPAAAASSVRGSTGERYEMLEELARGGMARVHRVFDRVTSQTLAMKRVTWDGRGDRFAVAALEREYAVLASLKHPRIIRVYDYGFETSSRYYTMELLDGRDMRELAPLPFRTACHYLRDLATSLALLHARRLIHRDLSPNNVRATNDGHCKLIDFGALSAFGPAPVIVGTPPTIAPEALRGEALDQRADLYSLGTLAYWMLTRRHAYPAREIAELPARWKVQPAPPSTYVAEVPDELDELVMSLLRANPLARPATAAEVIARLEVIGELPPDDSLETERAAQSFLLTPRFIGRALELKRLEADIGRCRLGHGTALSIRAEAGLGRTRLIDELALRGQLAGMAVLRADASAHRQTYGTARALLSNLADTYPDLVSQLGADASTLASVGLDIVQRYAPPPASEPPPSSRRSRTMSLDGSVAALSRKRRLLIAVDNVEQADDASLGFLFSLAQVAHQHPLLIVVSERTLPEPRQALGLVGLREHSSLIDLEPLTLTELGELVHSLFGDTPNSERYAEWLYAVCDGNPLYAIEICRQLAARDIIRYDGGLWSLPSEPPRVALPTGLGDALRGRLLALDEPSRSLAECLSLVEEQPTLQLCLRLVPGSSEIQVRQLLDTLALKGVLYPDGAGYRFSSTAIRDALLAQLDNARLADTHRHLGAALAAGADADSPLSRLQAGWQLIRGGEEERGADLIALVTHDSITARTLAANLHKIGKPIEAALLAYNHHRRSTYERVPLLCALAQAGYYEDRVWGERYGDHALDILEDVCGLATARRLRRFVGAWLALTLGLLSALVRFWMTPRAQRPYSFRKLITHLMTATTSLTGTAALSLDSARAGRVAATLEPFVVLPDRLTPKGLYQFCVALQHLGYERAAEAYANFDVFAGRIQDPRYYPTLPAEERRLLTASANFGRSALGVFRAHGAGVLESAEVLDDTGLKLYAMIASQIRYLYHMLRGEFQQAAPYRQQVDLHAAHMGSVWQVETWEAAALKTLYISTLADVVGATHLLHQLEAKVQRAPALERYRRLTEQALGLLRGDAEFTNRVAAEFEAMPPRSFIGWTEVMGMLARGFNTAGRHARALDICERTRTHLNDEDREYAMLFLGIELEYTTALAGLGEYGRALEHIDEHLARLDDCDHPLLLGLLHEARATICWKAGDTPGFSRSLAEVARWFSPTGVPALIAKHERLLQLELAKRSPSLLDPPPVERASTVRELQGTDVDTFGSGDTAVVTADATRKEERGPFGE